MYISNSSYSSCIEDGIGNEPERWIETKVFDLSKEGEQGVHLIPEKKFLSNIKANVLVTPGSLRRDVGDLDHLGVAGAVGGPHRLVPHGHQGHLHCGA